MSNETAVTVWTPPGLPTKDEFDTMRSMAIMYAKSDAVRPCFRGKPDNVFVAVSVGREIGIPPTLALTKGYVIEGVFQLEADVLADVVRRNVPGLSWEVAEIDGVLQLNDELCTIKGGIKGGREHTVTFTFKMAQDAGWTQGQNGIKNQWKPGARQDTMYAKCIRRLVKRTGGLWASAFTTADPDEVEVDNSRPPVKHEPSSATVVPDAPAVAAPTPASPEGGVAAPEQPKKVEVGEDWHYRLLCAFAQATRLRSAEFKERLNDPPTKNPGRARWAKEHAEELLRVINDYYASRDMAPIKSFAMFLPNDAENVALWLEAKNSAGNAGQDAPVAQDAPPAPTQEPERVPADPEPIAAGAAVATGEQDASGDAPMPEDAPLPEDDNRVQPDPVTAKTGEIADATVDGLLSYLDILRTNFKNARRFYQKHSTSGAQYLIDAKFLTELGHTQGGKPVSQKLDNLWAHEADRIMLARLVAETLLGKERS